LIGRAKCLSNLFRRWHDRDREEETKEKENAANSSQTRQTAHPIKLGSGMTETEGEMMERKKRSESGYGMHSTVSQGNNPTSGRFFSLNIFADFGHFSDYLPLRTGVHKRGSKQWCLRKYLCVTLYDLGCGRWRKVLNLLVESRHSCRHLCQHFHDSLS
jgi:hypothetical protein